MEKLSSGVRRTYSNHELSNYNTIHSVSVTGHGARHFFTHRASLKMIGFTILCYYMPKPPPCNLWNGQILRSRFLVDFQCVLDNFWVKIKIFVIKYEIKLRIIARTSQVSIVHHVNMCLLQCKTFNALGSSHATYTRRVFGKSIVFREFWPSNICQKVNILILCRSET